VTAATSIEPRRAALGEFLKARRAKVTPAEVGLPPGSRRRITGLRREEVALLAGVGVTWYTWLEQGRAINASAQVLDAVARTLRLGDVEREHLYQLAEATTKHRPATTTVPEPVLQLVGSMDLPAAVMNSRYDVFLKNDAYQDLFWGWHRMPCVHHNTLWCCFAEPNARDDLVNYDDEAPHVVARLRAEYAKHVGEPDWEEDIARLCERSDDFARFWASHEVAAPADRLRIFRHPLVGLLRLVNSELAVTAEVDLRLSVYTPADAETRDRLLLLRHERRAAA
jgi:hypothetical protein